MSLSILAGVYTLHYSNLLFTVHSNLPSIMELNTKQLKTLEVTERISIKKFVEGQGYEFVKGDAFYQLTKKETIQDYKFVVAKRKSDGEMITGDELRDVLKIPKKSVKKVSVDLDDVPDFDIFVQSTSYNRILLPGTTMLLRMDEDEEVETEPKKPASKRKADTRDDEDVSVDKQKKKVAAPGTGSVEVVFSFDTTGSMYACLSEVRRGIKDAIKRLKQQVPGIRLAIIAHGDYCDRNSSYVTRIQNFTEDEKTLIKFVSEVGSTGGGDADECYELVLRETRTKLDWSKDSIKSLVMIGDCNPHGPNYPLNTEKINWRTECERLKEDGVRVYAVQALNRSEATKFYRDLATLTDGFHLRLDQFASIVNFMMAICFREEGGDTLENYEEEIKDKKGMNRELHRLFATLQGRDPVAGAFADAVRDDDLVPVNPSRFQVLHVAERCSIKEFVQNNSLLFKTGRGFYEFTKPEKISDKKEVVLVDKETGDMFTGQEACDLIGAGGVGRIKPSSLDQWRVFVQSTSYNRVLMPDTGFLYEVDTDF